MSSEPETSNDNRPPASDPARLHVWQIQAVRDILLVVLVLAILKLGYEMSAITIPLLVALGLAYLFEPVISLMQKRFHFGRTAAVSVILGMFILGVVLVAVPVSLVVVGQTASFVRNASEGRYADGMDKAISLLPENVRVEVQKGKTWVESTVPWSARVFGDDDPTTTVAPDAAGDAPGDAKGDGSSDVKNDAGEDAKAPTPAAAAPGAVITQNDEDRIREVVRDEVTRLMNERADPLGSLLGTSTTQATPGPTEEKRWSFGSSALDLVGVSARRIWGFVLALIELGLVVFLVPFYFFFFATAYPKVIAFLGELVPHEHRKQIHHLVGSMDRAVSGFVRGRLVISAILGTIFAVGWLIVGVPYSLALGLVVGIFCAVPYLSIIGVPIAIGLLAVDQVSLPEAQRYAWWGIILWPSLVYFIGQTMDDWVLTPLIQGKTTDLDPVSIVVAILAGGTLAGLYGMLLAVPAAACIKIVLREIVMPGIREWSDGRSKDPLPGG